MKIIRIITAAFAASMVLFIRCSDTASDAGGPENVLDGIILEKAQRSGYYRAAALQAEKNGYAEVATYLGEIAEEERSHISKLSVIDAVVKKETKKNLTTLIALEKRAVSVTYPELIATVKEEGNDSLALLLEQMQADGKRHMLGLKGVLERVK